MESDEIALFIDKYSLRPGQYVVHFKTTIVNPDGVIQHDTEKVQLQEIYVSFKINTIYLFFQCYITIRAEHPIPIIKGGNVIEAPVGRDIIVSGINSIDNDIPGSELIFFI